MLPQAEIDADFISVAYNPGRAVRVNSPMLAGAIKLHTGKDTVFTLATRDMNRLALQSQLLGAQLLGLENVVVVQGDPFNERDLTLVKPVADIQPTDLITAISDLNEGYDFRGSRLRSPTDFCIGATVDLGRGLEAETALARRKVLAGAQFLITQPIFDVAEAARFLDVYAAAYGEALPLPVFWGLQILEKDGVVFSSVPLAMRQELERDGPEVEMALDLYQAFREAELRNIYLVPPIRRGGARNYDAAREFLQRRDR